MGKIAILTGHPSPDFCTSEEQGSAASVRRMEAAARSSRGGQRAQVNIGAGVGELYGSVLRASRREEVGAGVWDLSSGVIRPVCWVVRKRFG
jgi:hypothetical protein